MGGAQFLFLRLAEYLSAQNHHIQYVDYMPEGFAFSHSGQNTKIGFKPYIQGQVDLRDTTIVASAFHIPFMRLMLGRSIFEADHNVSFLFWHIHPENANLALTGGGRKLLPRRTERNAILREMADRNQIVFMDGVNADAFQGTVGQVQEPTFLPISAPIKVPPTRRSKPRRQTTNLCWLGRLDADKHWSVKKIIDDISISHDAQRLKLLIIGGGSHSKDISDYAKNKGVNISMLGYLTGDKLHDTIIRDVDLGISMGTSCLEIAGMGVPSAIVDFSFDQLPSDTQYDWVYDARSFEVGKNALFGHKRKHSLNSLITQLENRADDTAKRCYEHVQANHSIGAVAGRLSEILSAQEHPSTLSLSEEAIDTLLPRYYAAAFTTLRYLKNLRR